MLYPCLTCVNVFDEAGGANFSPKKTRRHFLVPPEAKSPVIGDRNYSSNKQIISGFLFFI
jgi:hypothetical protein